MFRVDSVFFVYTQGLNIFKYILTVKQYLRRIQIKRYTCTSKVFSIGYSHIYAKIVELWDSILIYTTLHFTRVHTLVQIL